MLAVLLGIWLAVSVVAQLEVVVPRLKVIRRFDPLSLVPQFNFFAPVPGTKDFHLMARSGTAADLLGRWREVPSPPRQRWLNCIWNPVRRERKALFDLATTLAKENQIFSRTAIQMSVSYLALLNHVTCVIGPQGGSHVQFMIMISPGLTPAEAASAVFVSHPHRIG